MRLPPGLSSRKLACPSQVRVAFAICAAYLCRNVRLGRETGRVSLRLAPPGLAVVALLAALGGAGGFAPPVVLGAVLRLSGRLLGAVGPGCGGARGPLPGGTSAPR